MARYKVIGSREVLEHQPGEEFEAKLDKVQEARLVAGGHIERVKKESRANASENNEQSKNDEQTADEA